MSISEVKQKINKKPFCYIHKCAVMQISAVFWTLETSGFLKSASNVEHFEKKMTFIAYIFPKLETVKEVVS